MGDKRKMIVVNMEEAMGYKLTAVWYNFKNQKLGFDKSSVCDWEKKIQQNY